MADEALIQIHNLSGTATASLIFVGAIFYSFLGLVGSLVDLFCTWVKSKINKGDKKDNV